MYSEEFAQNSRRTVKATNANVTLTSSVDPNAQNKKWNSRYDLSAQKEAWALESHVNRREHAFARNSNPSRAFFTHAPHSHTTTMTTTTTRRDYAYVLTYYRCQQNASEWATAREYRRDQSRRYDSSARVNALYSLTIISRLLYDRGQDVTFIKHLTRHLVGLTEIEVLKKVKGFIVSLDIIWNDGNRNFVRFDQRNG